MGMSQLRIKQLSPFVANQISAGEVIERPASVVKELLENALDSGADVVSIEIGYGGLNQVKISDNGSGILADDLPLAIAAHATSKIIQLNDLYALSSMGFRGEALASIAAVSRLSLSSKPQTQEHAMMIRSSPEGLNLLPCPRSCGTTVDVLDLFYNAPVRKKFLKSARIEYQAIEMVVKRFALSAPTIALTLKHDGKETLTLPAATSEKTKLLRIRKLLGKQFMDHAIYLDVLQGGMRLLGWASGQAYQRSQNDRVWVYINQRMVKDKLVNHAIKQAYANILHPGRSPACVLYLTLPSQDIDVNVHPTKHEVRFQQPRLIHDFILSSISNVLLEDSSENTPLKSVQHNNSHPALVAREGYYRQTLRAHMDVAPPIMREWLILNDRFVVLFVQDEPYLVDIEPIQQQCFLSMLNQQPLPLDSRPLLVPVSHTVKRSEHELLSQYQPILKQLGVQLDWMGDTSVVIRTVPLLLPQLDLQQLLNGLTSPVLLQSALMKRLVDCQSSNVHQLNHEDKIRVVDYLQQQCLTVSPFSSWCIHLNVEQCKAVLGVTQ